MIVVLEKSMGTMGGQKNSKEGADHTPLRDTVGGVSSAIFSRALST
jgi:hypothetical protein